jgi:ABC-2 type transport system permease protein
VSALRGTPLLARVALRRDRIVLPVCAWLLVATVAGTAASFASLYPGIDERVAFGADVEHNSGLRAFYGPLPDATTIGGLTAWRMGVMAIVLLAVLNLLIVVRHTRGEEESGRLELVGAGAVGRAAPLTSALLVVWAADLAFALALALVAQGETVAGSLALGLGIAVGGGLFGAVAACTAQVTERARLASGLAAAALGVAFVLRAAGDAGDGASWLTWLSPIGWSEQVRAFGGERWWPLLLSVAATGALTAAAFVLSARRDLGGGLLTARLGPARAGRGLRGPLALAWRLQRGALAGWAVGFLAGGAALCGLADSARSLLDDNRQLLDLFRRLGGEQGLVDAFLATIVSMLGLIAAAYAVQAVLRLRGEETAQRAEPLLAAGVERLRWAVSHLLFAFMGTAFLLLCAGVAGGLSYGLVAGDVGGQLGRVTGAALAQAPAAWVTAAVALAFVGLAPRRSNLSWAVVVLFLALGQFGAVLQLPQWLIDLSPFAHVPRLPGTAAPAGPLLALTAVAAVVGAAGLAGLRRRDIG